MLPTVPVRGSTMEKFRAIKAAGFEGTEPRSGMNQTEVLQARDATGLHIPSVSCLTNWNKPLSDPDPAIRKTGLQGLKTALRDAKAYGATSVLLVPAVVNDRVTYQDAWQRSIEQIRKALPLAEDLGVKIAIENVWNKFIISPLEAARYIDQFNSPAIGWHFDIGNVLAFGWPQHWVPVLGQRIQKLHVKEYSRKKQETEGALAGFHVNYLEGDNDWPEIMAALDAVPYTTWAIAEPPWHPPGMLPQDRLHDIATRIDKIFTL